jgi:copper chaperone CopZ
MVFVILCLASALCGCRIEDRREHQVAVPQMKSAEDAARIKAVLSGLRGVEIARCVFDTQAGKITVYHDSMIVAHKNIEIAIAEAGYDANSIGSLKSIGPLAAEAE